MTWFKVDDGLHSHPKWLAAPPAAKALWGSAGSWCAAHLTDGHVPRHALPLLGARPRDAAELVRVGLWEPYGDGWLFHDWSEYQPSKEKVLADRDVQRRRAALNADPKIRAALKARDCDRCRYCAVDVNWRDRKGPTGATYDHVVPLNAGGQDTVENLVVCCRACNERKGAKTLEEAGMTLLPVPGQIKQTSRSDPDPPPRSDQPPVPTRPDPSTSRGATTPTTAPGQPPPTRCPTHQHWPPDQDIPDCRACGDARRTHDAWRAQQSTFDHRLAGQQQAQRTAAEEHMRTVADLAGEQPDPARNVDAIAHIRSQHHLATGPEDAA